MLYSVMTASQHLRLVQVDLRSMAASSKNTSVTANSYRPEYDNGTGWFGYKWNHEHRIPPGQSWRCDYGMRYTLMHCEVASPSGDHKEDIQVGNDGSHHEGQTRVGNVRLNSVKCADQANKTVIQDIHNNRPVKLASAFETTEASLHLGHLAAVRCLSLQDKT